LRGKVGKPKSCAFAALVTLTTAFCSGCRDRVAEKPPARAPVVEVAPVIQQNVPVYGEWVGTFQGYLNAQIAPQVSGYLVRQDYQEGGLVRKDEVLFEIDPRPFQAVLDQANAQLAGAKAQLAKTSLDVQRDIPEAQAHAIPESQLDDDRQAQLAAKATVEADEAAVEEAALNLGYTKVRSLIPGIAGITTVQVGNLVGPSTVLTSVSEVNPIKVYFPITGVEYLRIASRVAGAVDLLSQENPIPLQLILSDGETYGYKGRILFTDRQVDPQTGTIQVVGAFPNPRNILRPGDTCRVRAMTDLIKGALLVPQRAVTELQGGYQVAIVGPNNKIDIRTVRVGERVGTMWVVSDGLKPGQRVVAEGTQMVRDGMVVIPEPYTAPTEKK